MRVRAGINDGYQTAGVSSRWQGSGGTAGRLGEALGERRGGGLSVDVLLQALPRVVQVALVDDVVALEDAARRVSEQHHGDAFGDPGAYEIPRGGPTAVVQAPSGHPRDLAGPPPRR